MFALPYAGGSASIYRDWISELKPEIEVCPIEYPGHASRFCDPYYSSIEAAAEEISETILRKNPSDYVIYGHSMGALIALETAFVLEKKTDILPKAVIVAASRPPHMRNKGINLRELSKEELLQTIVSRGQFEPEILECEELMEMIADILYADVQMFTRYTRSYEERKIHVPLLALFGEEDEETPQEDMQEWQKYTEQDFSLQVFRGNHFFAFNNHTEFVSYLRKYLKEGEKKK